MINTLYSVRLKDTVPMEDLNLPTATKEGKNEMSRNVPWVSADDPLKWLFFRDRLINNECVIPDTQRCSVCYDMVNIVKVRVDSMENMVKLTDVKAGAQGGCCGCALTNGAFERVRKEYTSPQDSTKVDINFRQGSDVLLDVSIGVASGNLGLNLFGVRPPCL